MSSGVSWASSCWFLLAKRIRIQICYTVPSSLIVYFPFKVLTLCWKEGWRKERQTVPSPRVLFSRSCFAWSLVMRLLPSRYSRNFCEETQLRQAWKQKHLTAGSFKHRTRINFLNAWINSIKMKCNVQKKQKHYTVYTVYTHYRPKEYNKK